MKNSDVYARKIKVRQQEKKMALAKCIKIPAEVCIKIWNHNIWQHILYLMSSFKFNMSTDV